MVRVNGSEQIMRLVQQQLERLSRSRKKAATSARSASTDAASVGRHSPIEAMRGLRNLDAQEFNRVAVRSILTLELGNEIVDDPQFSRIADRIEQIVEADPELSALFLDLRRSLS